MVSAVGEVCGLYVHVEWRNTIPNQGDMKGGGGGKGEASSWQKYECQESFLP